MATAASTPTRPLKWRDRLKPYRLYWMEEMCRSAEDLARFNEACCGAHGRRRVAVEFQ